MSPTHRILHSLSLSVPSLLFLIIKAYLSNQWSRAVPRISNEDASVFAVFVRSVHRAVEALRQERLVTTERVILHEANR